MDGRDQLASLARAISSASDIENAWAGTGSAIDVRKECGICGESQPMRIPFLRHVCRGCAAIWVPGICGDCAHTSVTFTIDGQLSRFARCGCGGGLRQVAYVPKPRAYVAPEVAAARAKVSHRRKRVARRSERIVLVVIAVAALLGCLRFITTDHTGGAPRSAVPVAHPVTAPASLTASQRGQRAAENLAQHGRGHDAFTCLALLPAATSASPAPSASAAPTLKDPEDQAFFTACLAG